MAGWSHQKRLKVEQSFRLFLRNCYINSKDEGRVCLGDALYDAQIIAITEIFDALESDIHDVYILKSRQLGISTIVRALVIFLLGVLPGLKGAIVFDTDQNKSESRSEIEVMIHDLPKSLKFSTIKSNNRTGLTLSNDSKVLFMAAGVRKSKTSGTLGRSVGLSLAHLSELCSYDNEEGLEAFQNSLSDVNPDRLYIRESTARGYNRWNDMWREARADPTHAKCVFIGWWAKPSQRIDKSHPDFAMYGEQPPSDKELIKIKKVKQTYGYEVTAEQLAWYRRKMDPSAVKDDEGKADYEASPLRIQEQPWDEEEAFQQTGAVFFGAEALTALTNKHVKKPIGKYFFWVGQEFFDMRVYAATTNKMTELKVWEEPEKDASYVIGVDPAFGENENNDRSAIQVMKCYADGIDQVAEYAWPLVTTYQLAWVIASLLGWYGQQGAEVRYVMEINGPGTAVFNELRSLRARMEGRLNYREYEERGLQDLFRNVRTYIWSRADSMGAGYNYHLKCLSVDTPIPTSDGWVKLGDVRQGDTVFDERGESCAVLAASNIKYDAPCYRVVFDNGSDIIADADHIWSVKESRKGVPEPRWKTKLVKTSDLVTESHKIPVAKALVISDKNLPIPPYVLGLWLGDGYSADARFCSHQDDLEELSSYVADEGFSLGPVAKCKTALSDDKTYMRTIHGLRGLLVCCNLLKNKHIPKEYLRASFAQRLDLLQGLMDTDGTCNAKNGRQCAFSTSNYLLARTFFDLLSSLGIKAKCLLHFPKLIYEGKSVACEGSYFFYFTGYPELPVFRLQRKLKKLAYVGERRFGKSRYHRIVSVERLPISVPVRCLQVDSPSSLFLAGSSMVPTHNTTNLIKVPMLERLRDFVANGLLRIRSMELIEEMKKVTREGDSIGAPGSMKDDRVLAAAFAVHCWEEKARRPLIARKYTRAAEQAQKSLAVTDRVALFQQNQLQAFFDKRRIERTGLERQMRYQAWRSAGRRY